MTASICICVHKSPHKCISADPVVLRLHLWKSSHRKWTQQKTRVSDSSLKSTLGSICQLIATCNPRGFNLGVLRPRRWLLSFRGCMQQEQETAFLLSRLSPWWPFVHSARQDGSSFAVKIYFSLPPSSRLPSTTLCLCCYPPPPHAEPQWIFFFLEAAAAIPDTPRVLLPTKA